MNAEVDEELSVLARVVHEEDLRLAGRCALFAEEPSKIRRESRPGYDARQATVRPPPQSASLCARPRTCSVPMAAAPRCQRYALRPHGRQHCLPSSRLAPDWPRVAVPEG